MLVWGQWWSYTSDVVAYDSDAFGVYELADENKNTVYYGSGKVKTRLQDHLNKKECPRARLYRIDNMTETECRAREEQLLEEYKKAHGKLPMYNERVG